MKLICNLSSSWLCLSSPVSTIFLHQHAAGNFELLKFRVWKTKDGWPLKLSTFVSVQVFQTACRQGHFRLTVHNSNESGSVDFGMHAFTVGAAIISLMRWLSELRERLPKDGPAMLRQQVCMTVNKGKPSREHAYPNIKAAITSLLQGCHSPFRSAALHNERTERKVMENSPWGGGG